MIEFNPETHVYTVCGHEVPGVTDILRASNIGHSAESGGYEIPDDVLENAKERGTYIHAAIRLLELDDLDEDDLDEEVAGAVAKYRDWRDGYAAVWQLVSAESPLYSAEHDFAGTPDLVFVAGVVRVVVDIKSGGGGLKPWHSLQLAAYGLLANAEERVVVDLSGKKAKAINLNRKELFYERETFLAARRLWEWRALRGISNK